MNGASNRRGQQYIVVFFFMCIHAICPAPDFSVASSSAIAPDANSGDNYAPERATIITPTLDSRWVNYDRGDQTDWLKVLPPDAGDRPLEVTFEFTTLIGAVIVEVYANDPHAPFLERKELTEPQSYSYTISPPVLHYFKLYAGGKGELANYTFVYSLKPVPTPSPTASPTAGPLPIASRPAVFHVSVSDPLGVFRVFGGQQVPWGSSVPVSASPEKEAPSSGVEMENEDEPGREPSTQPSPARQVAPLQHASLEPMILPGVSPAALVFSIALIVSLVVNVVLLSRLVRLPRPRNNRSHPSAPNGLAPAEYELLGHFAAQQGKMVLAERCYRNVIERDPRHTTIHHTLGALLLQAERYAEAVQELELALQGEVIPPEVYHDLACTYLAVGQLKKARKTYQKACEFSHPTACHIASPELFQQLSERFGG